jgi:hypothetical protein
MNQKETNATRRRRRPAPLGSGRRGVGKDRIDGSDVIDGSDLKSTLVLDLCEGIIEMPALDREVLLSRRGLESAYEELHDLATTLAEHLIKSAEALSAGTSTKEGARR